MPKVWQRAQDVGLAHMESGKRDDNAVGKHFVLIVNYFIIIVLFSSFDVYFVSRVFSLLLLLLLLLLLFC